MNVNFGLFPPLQRLAVKNAEGVRLRGTAEDDG